MASTVTDRIDGLSTSVALKAPCRVATTENITISGLQTIDGVSLAADDRVLVKDQTDASENGIYLANTSAWSRAKDFNGARDAVNGTRVYVAEGASTPPDRWRLSASNPVVIGTDDLTWVADDSLDISEWIKEQSATYVSSTSFTVSGDQRADFHDERRLKLSGSATGTIYGSINGDSTYSAGTDKTTVTLTDITDSSGTSATLSNEALTVWVGVASYGPTTSLPGKTIRVWPDSNRAQIQAKIDEMRASTFSYGFVKLEFETARYEIDGSLDLTNLRNSFLIIDLQGSTIAYEGSGSEPIIDMVGTRNMLMMNGYIRSETTGASAPQDGILMGRLDDGSVASKNAFFNIKVAGELSGYGWYNYAGERTDWMFCSVDNTRDNASALCITRTNIEGRTSAFVTMGTADASCNHHTFHSSEWRAKPNQATMYLESANDVQFTGTTYFRADVPSGSSADVILVDSNSGGSSGIRIPNLYWESQSGQRPDYGVRLKSATGKGITDVDINVVLGANVNTAVYAVESNNQLNRVDLSGSASNATDTAVVPLIDIISTSPSPTMRDIKLRSRNDCPIDLTNAAQFTGEVFIQSAANLTLDYTADPLDVLVRTDEGSQRVSGAPLKTIASGVVDADLWEEVYVDGEGSTTDSLDYLVDGLFRGQTVTLLAYVDSYDITINHASGSPGTGQSAIILKDAPAGGVVLNRNGGSGKRAGIMLKWNHRADSNAGAWVEV